MSYGAFWWSLFVLLYVQPKTGIPAGHPEELGFFLMWTLFTLAFCVAAQGVGKFLAVGFLLAGFLVGLHLVVIDFRQVLSVRSTSEVLLLAAGVMFGLCAVVFYANALLVGQRWKLFFGDSPDEQLLCGHSYLGGFAAVAAAWALCSNDWTAIAFAGIITRFFALGFFSSYHA